MQKIRLFLVLMCVASVFSFVSCGTETETEFPRTVVTGQVVNRTDDNPTNNISWGIFDPFTVTDEDISTELSEDGSFRMETQEVSLFRNNTLNYNIDFFIAPGDSIHVVIDAAKMRDGVENAVIFTGDRARLNNEQLGCLKYMFSVVNPDLWDNQLNMDMEPVAMIAQLNERLTKYQDSLVAYEKRQTTPLSNDLKDFIRRDNIFTLSSHLLDYKRDDHKVRSELFSDPFFGISDPQNFITIRFSHHLNEYMSDNVYSDTTVRTPFRRLDHSTGVNNGVRILMAEPASLVRDVMMWKFLSHFIKEYPTLYDSIPEIKRREVFTDVRLDRKLENLVKEITTMNFPVTPIDGISYLEPSDSTVIELPKCDIFAHLAQKHPGKVLYINVYNTWWSPCIDNMENNTPALPEPDKGKDVVFVNLCLNSEAQKWRQVVKLYNLTHNYLLDNTASTLFMRAYNISSRKLPTYILIGKDGKTATKFATNTMNSAKLRELIKESYGEIFRALEGE